MKFSKKILGLSLLALNVLSFVACIVSRIKSCSV
mgnify:CR=1 FL=1